MNVIRFSPGWGAWLLLLGTTLPAQEFDILVQHINNQLVTGNVDHDGNVSLGQRVFAQTLDSMFYTSSNPGFNSIAGNSPTLPPGSSGLPGGLELDWDFLPLKVGVVKSALLYWNSQGAVAFGPPPSINYGLSFFSLASGGASATANSSSQLVPGGRIVNTASNGFLHEHGVYFLDSGDNNSSGTPAPGIYLTALQLRMAGLTSSAPFFLLSATPGVSTAGAIAWVNARVDRLVRPGPPGDFNENGVVDAADYTVWRDTVGSNTDPSADADLNLMVDDADLAIWRTKFGVTGSAVAVAESVPEPKTIFLLLAMLLPRLTSGALYAWRASRFRAPDVSRTRYRKNCCAIA